PGLRHRYPPRRQHGCLNRTRAWLLCRSLPARGHRLARYGLSRSLLCFNRGGIAKRYGQSYSRTFPRRRLDLKVAVNILGSFIHIKKSATGINIDVAGRSEEHTSELQSRENLVCRLLLEKKKKKAT